MDQTSSLVCNFKHIFIFVVWLDTIAALYVVNEFLVSKETVVLRRWER